MNDLELATRFREELAKCAPEGHRHSHNGNVIENKIWCPWAYTFVGTTYTPHIGGPTCNGCLRPVDLELVEARG